MKRGQALGLIVTLGGLPVAVAALQAPAAGPSAAAPAATGIEKVKENLYIITGSSPTVRESFSGGNTGVFITDRGVILVDTKLAGWGPTLLERIRTVTDKPVVTVINTHTHGDHTGSNEFFGASVESVVQENTKTNMARMDAFKGEKAKFLPTRTYKETLTLGSGKDQVDLYHFGAGHTSGDTFVVYTALRTIHTGDMFPWRDAPFIDRNNGGSGIAWPATLKKLLENVKNVDTVISGHQPVGPWEDLEEFQRFTTDLLAEARAARAAGKTVEEAAAAKDWMKKYPGYNSTRLQAAVQAIYDELNGK
ncbi:MAG: MBL fold metallo-hydrolase [Vicinamibacteria bacterium]|nr:MBL fold metallo-hydrolase [Vicinamibacteria bacterium]